MKHFPSSAEDIFLPIMTFLCSICSTPRENMAKIFGRLDWRQLHLTVGSCCVFPALIQRKLFYKYHCLSQSLSQSQSCLRRASDTKWWAMSFTPVFVWYVRHLSVAGARIQDGVEDEHPETTVGGCKKRCRGGWIPLFHHSTTEKQSQNLRLSLSLKSLTALLISIVSKHGTKHVIKTTTESVLSFDFSRVIFRGGLQQPLAGNPRFIMSWKLTRLLSQMWGCESCNIGFINWIVSPVLPTFLEFKKKKEKGKKYIWWISQDAHFKRQSDERERDFSIGEQSQALSSTIKAL